MDCHALRKLFFSLKAFPHALQTCGLSAVWYCIYNKARQVTALSEAFHTCFANIWLLTIATHLSPSHMDQKSLTHALHLKKTTFYQCAQYRTFFKLQGCQSNYRATCFGAVAWFVLLLHLLLTLSVDQWCLHSDIWSNWQSLVNCRPLVITNLLTTVRNSHSFISRDLASLWSCSGWIEGSLQVSVSEFTASIKSFISLHWQSISSSYSLFLAGKPLFLLQQKLVSRSQRFSKMRTGLGNKKKNIWQDMALQPVRLYYNVLSTLPSYF